MSKGPRDGIYERPGKNGITRYCFQIRKKGFPPVFQSHRRKTDAVKERNKILTAMEDGKFLHTTEARKHTLRELIERYEKGHKEKISTSKQAAEIRWWKEQLGAHRLSDLTPVLITEYRDRLLQEVTVRGKSRSNGSVRRYLAALSHIFNMAIKEFGWLQENPMSKVNKPKESRGRVRFLSDTERERLLDVCEKSSNKLLYPIVVLALSTGMRLGELIKLRWHDINLPRERITLHDTKNGERRSVPIKGLALQLIIKLHENRNRVTDLIFPGISPNKPIDPRFSWETALKVAQIENFRFHDLRHCCASYLAMNGATLMEIAEVLGHKTLAMVKRYAHLSDSHKDKVVSDMNAVIFRES
jgi:integrase